MSDEKDDGASVDPRRALGRRPGSQPLPKLKIESRSLSVPSQRELDLPASPHTQQISLSINSPSNEVSSPSSSVPSSPNLLRFRRPTIHRSRKINAASSRGLYETQKLLSHLLDKLEVRETAPDLLSRATVAAKESISRKKRRSTGTAIKIGHAAATVARAGLSVAQGQSGSRSKTEHGIGLNGISSEDYDDSSDLGTGDWDTDSICDLVEQTRGLLVLSEKQQLDLFSSNIDFHLAKPHVPPTKKKIGRFSSFTSPISPTISTMDEIDSVNTDGAAASGRGLLSRLTAVLSSLIRVDCLYRTRAFHLLRPPNGLQAACLDIASFLYEKSDPEDKVEICEIVIDGLYTMGSTMSERICEWLDGRMSDLLRRLMLERGGSGVDHAAEATMWNDPFESNKSDPTLPTFAISTATSDPGVQASTPGWMRYSPTSPETSFFPPERLLPLSEKVPTTTAVDPSMVQLASLIPRLIAGLTSTLNLSANLTTIYRFHRLISLVVTAKPDISLDLLEIVASASAPSCRGAAGLLVTLYPEVVGHNVVAQRPPMVTYHAQRTLWEQDHGRMLKEASSDEHHFVPWRISKSDGGISDPIGSRCEVCRGDIHGFCIRCTLCNDTRHLHCYQYNMKHQGFRYTVTTVSARDSLTQSKHLKFSLCPIPLNEKLLCVGQTGCSRSTRHTIGQHDLRLVNVFTLSLCQGCRLPLWGGRSQAYACFSGCQRLFHPECMTEKALGRCVDGIDIVIDEVAAQGQNPFTVTLADLQASFQPVKQNLCCSHDEVEARSYDEIAILYGSLWIQYQIIKNGLSSGCLTVTAADRNKADSDILGLRPFLRIYEEHLRLHQASASSAASDFARISNGGRTLGQGYLFSNRYLTYCTALLHSPASPNILDSSSQSVSYLVPDVSFSAQSGSHDQESSKACDVSDLTRLARSLAIDINIYELNIAALFINQLHAFGLVLITQHAPITAQDLGRSDKLVTFGLPLLMDASPITETLVTAIEVLLDHIDLCLNEIGLALLAKRAFPSLLCSPYALERLGGILVKWVYSEDHIIHKVVQEYASKHRSLPGVRSGVKGNTSIQVYKENRDALRERYVRPWLEALHAQDATLYAQMVYDQCRSTDAAFTRSEIAPPNAGVHIAGIASDHLSALEDQGLLFFAHLDLLTAWLEDLGTLATEDHVYRALPRLLKQATTSNLANSGDDIWTRLQLTLLDGPSGVANVNKWLRVMAFSGVEVPWALLTEIIELQGSDNISLSSTMDLIIAVSTNSTSINSANLAILCCRMFINFVDSQIAAEQQNCNLSQIILRRMMIVILRAYGVHPEGIAGTHLDPGGLLSTQSSDQSKRKKKNGILPALIELDGTVVERVATLLERNRFLAADLLDFLWLLFTQSSNAVNIDGFLYKQCIVLYPVLWRMFDSDDERLCRTRVFLRLLAVNPKPVEVIIQDEFHSGDRVKLKERLLRFVLQLADSELTAFNLSWRKASVGLIILFFQAILDHTDLNPDNLVIVQGIMPTQLQAISACFGDFLVQSSDESRLTILSHIHRLRLALPLWPVLSWRTIDDLLTEINASISQMAPAKTIQTISALHDAQRVRADLIALGLNMLSAGINVSWTLAQRFQQNVAKSSSLPWDGPIENITALILPALRSALDSPFRIAVDAQPVEGNGKPKKLALVGALFVPVVIEYGKELVSEHDFMTKRLILDIINTVILKHNTRSVEFSALSALQSIAEACRDGPADENRLFAISILQTAISRIDEDSLFGAIPPVFASIAELLVKESESGGGDHAINQQSRALLRTIIDTFGRSRLFVHLFKNDAVSTSSSKARLILGKAFRILQSSEKMDADGVIKNDIINLAIDDLSYALKRDRQTLRQVLESFERFVQCIEGWISEEAVLSYGAFITRLGKHVADWGDHEFDPDPTLRSSSLLLNLSPGTSAVLLLHQVSTLLHLCLSRFSVESTTVSKLVAASSTITNEHKTEDTIWTVISDAASSSAHGHAVAPVTLNALLALAVEQASRLASGRSQVGLIRQLLADAAEASMTILLRSHPTSSTHSSSTTPDAVLSILRHSGMILVHAETIMPGTLSHYVAKVTEEAAIVQLEVFTHILASSLEVFTKEGRSNLISLYPVLARAASLCLRASADLLSVTDVAGEGADNLSAVFVVFRLAILATSGLLPASEEAPKIFPEDSPIKQPQSTSIEESAVDELWSRIWPDWQRLLSLSVQPTCINGPLKNIAQTVFLDTLIFLDHVQSPLLVNYAGSFCDALSVLHKSSGTMTSGHGGAKMIKAEKAVRRAGVSSTSVDVKGLVKTIKGDLLAAERLKGLRAASTS